MRLPTFLSAAMIAAASIPTQAIIIPQQAQAQNLFDLLFKRRNQRQQQPVIVAPQPSQERVKRAPAPVPVVSRPIYFTYKAAAPVLLAASSLTPALAETGAPSLGALSGPSFAEALPHAGDFSIETDAKVRDAMKAYYDGGGNFVWVKGFHPTEAARQIVEVMKAAGEVGLDPSDYQVTVPEQGFDMADTAARFGELARFEIAMSAAVLRYSRDASSGRVDPNKISEYHDLTPEPFDGRALLSEYAASADSVLMLKKRNPENPEFAALVAELAHLRSLSDFTPTIEKGTFIRPGQDNPELPDVMALVKSVLADVADLPPEQKAILEGDLSGTLYTDQLVPLVKAAQEAKGTKPDGIIGPNTVTAFQGRTVGERIAKVEMAMERLRWLPDDLGWRHVIINQPEFRASYVVGNKTQLAMNVVVGTKRNQTSFFSDEIEYVEWNPYWGVPQSIIVNEMLPKLRNDPGYLDRIGYEVFNASGKRVSSSSVDWWGGGYRGVAVRQPPSEKNALGELKIMFPNKHDIYMHDTPAKNLFSRSERAYSHGCVRLAQPREMAAAVLQTTVGVVEQNLAKGHHRTNLPSKIPVHVAYFTAWPDDDGKVHYFGDVYERDDHLATAISATRDARGTFTGATSQ